MPGVGKELVKVLSLGSPLYRATTCSYDRSFNRYIFKGLFALGRAGHRRWRKTTAPSLDSSEN